MTDADDKTVRRFQRSGSGFVQQVALALTVFVIVSVFSSRAVYMDEHIFVTLGRNALENPLYPSDIEFVFFGVRANLESHTHPPVGDYYLAAVVALFPDFHENLYRILFSIFPILAAIGFYRLARRLTAAPFCLTLLLISSPAFFVMSPTLMMDIPMLAFFLLGLDVLLASRERPGWRLPVASVLFVLSAGTGYTALVPMGCLFVWILATRPRVRELSAIAAAPIVLVAWQIAMAAHFGHVPITSTVGYFLDQVRSSLENTATTLSFLGGVTLVPWAGIAVVGGTRNWRLVAATTSFAAGLVASDFSDWPSVAARIWYATLAGAGLFLIVRAATEAANGAREDDRWPLFLLMWLGAVLAFFILVGDMINARYMLLAIPPLYLLVFRLAQPRSLVWLAALTFALSTGVAVADYRFVNGYRAWVDEVVVPLRSAGYAIWSGAESGLRFYVEEAGGRVLAADSLDPSGGDMVVRDVFAYGLAEELSVRLVQARTDILQDRFPIRTFNMTAGAGFHDSRFGRVPYTLSAAPYDRVSIWQVSPLVGDLRQPADREPVVWSPEGPVLIQQTERLAFPYDAPIGAVLRYEVPEGAGTAVLVNGAIELRRESDGPVSWRNLRVVPPDFPAEP